jgi:hypothetical protein
MEYMMISNTAGLRPTLRHGRLEETRILPSLCSLQARWMHRAFYLFLRLFDFDSKRPSSFELQPEYFFLSSCNNLDFRAV